MTVVDHIHQSVIAEPHADRDAENEVHVGGIEHGMNGLNHERYIFLLRVVAGERSPQDGDINISMRYCIDELSLGISLSGSP